MPQSRMDILKLWLEHSKQLSTSTPIFDLYQKYQSMLDKAEPPMPQQSTWSTQLVKPRELQALLASGWEPYGVAAGLHWVKRKTLTIGSPTDPYCVSALAPDGVFYLWYYRNSRVAGSQADSLALSGYREVEIKSGVSTSFYCNTP